MYGTVSDSAANIVNACNQLYSKPELVCGPDDGDDEEEEEDEEEDPDGDAGGGGEEEARMK